MARVEQPANYAYDPQSLPLESFVGSGAYHGVFGYGKDQVIKIPKSPDMYIELQPVDEVILEHEIVTANCPFALKTTVVPHKDSYYLLQRRLTDFDFVSPRNMYLVADQLEELTQINRGLINTFGCSMDFLGKEGVINTLTQFAHPKQILTLPNLVIDYEDGTPQLRLIDLGVLPAYHTSFTQKLKSKVAQLWKFQFSCLIQSALTRVAFNGLQMV